MLPDWRRGRQATSNQVKGAPAKSRTFQKFGCGCDLVLTGLRYLRDYQKSRFVQFLSDSRERDKSHIKLCVTRERALHVY